MKDEIEYLQDEIGYLKTHKKLIINHPKGGDKERALKCINNEIRLLSNILNKIKE